MPAKGLSLSISAGQEPDLFELAGVEQVRLVDHDDDAFAAFGALVREQLVRLRDQGGGVEAGLAAEAGDDLVVEPAGADARVGEVDDRVAGSVEVCDGG